MIKTNKLKHIKVVIKTIYLIVMKVLIYMKMEINILVALNKVQKLVKVFT